MNVSDLDIKKIRAVLGKTQEEFAEMIGVSPKTVRNYEAGKVIPKSKLLLLQQIQSGNITGNNNVNANNSVIHGGIDNRQYYSDNPDVLRAQIDELDRMLKEKEERIREKDAQIREKDAQIKSLLEIMKK